MNDARHYGAGTRRLQLSPSGAYAATVLAVHAAAAACLLTTMTGFAGPALALLTLALGGVAAWERALLRGRGAPRAIEIPATGAAVVVLGNGTSFAVRAVRGMGVTRHWVALAPLAFAGRSVLVTSGMLGPAGARVLRLWALWGRTPGVAARQQPA